MTAVVGLGSSIIVYPRLQNYPGDMVFAFGSQHSVAKSIVGSKLVTTVEPVLDSLLGPFQDNQTAVCHGMIFSKMREQLGQKDRKSFHCDICTAYVVRRLLEEHL